MVSVRDTASCNLSCTDSTLDLPDLADTDNVIYLDRWDGTWAYLCTLKWVRITKAGDVQKSSFPPKGQS